LIQPDLIRIGRAIVEDNAYLTLATADAQGSPWASPVWFAHDRYTRYVWVSRPEARHSRNIAVRSEVGIVVFDSTVPDGTGQGVYIEATAGLVGEADLEPLLTVFSDRSEARGGARWTRADISGGAPHRLYVAEATAQFVLGDHDERIPVALGQ